MTVRPTRPPRLAMWLIERVIPPNARDAAIGDLDEEFEHEIVPRLGAARARRWYWLQAFSLARAFSTGRRRASEPHDQNVSRSDTMRHDIRDALRMLIRSPGYSAITIAVLALGIGATSAIFSFVDGVLLRPLPYDEPDRIVWVWEKPRQGLRNTISTENFLDWRRGSADVFEVMAAITGSGVTMAGGVEPVQIPGQRVSPGYFDVFGARAALGRTFSAEEGQPGKDKVAVITYRLWQRQFAGDPGIIGKVVTFNGEPHTIIGVMPAASAFERGNIDVWRPLAFRPADMTRKARWLRSVARLKPGVTIDQARTRMDPIATRLAHDYPDQQGDGDHDRSVCGSGGQPDPPPIADCPDVGGRRVAARCLRQPRQPCPCSGNRARTRGRHPSGARRRTRTTLQAVPPRKLDALVHRRRARPGVRLRDDARTQAAAPAFLSAEGSARHDRLACTAVRRRRLDSHRRDLRNRTRLSGRPRRSQRIDERLIALGHCGPHATTSSRWIGCGGSRIGLHAPCWRRTLDAKFPATAAGRSRQGSCRRSSPQG